jgi:predicted KAP-like P-loop ATPase
MLGDRLYYAAMDDKVERDEIKELFNTSFEEEKVATTTYFYWAKRLATIAIPHRV